VERRRDASDARLLRVALTPAAVQALPGWVERARAITAATLAPLPVAEAARVVAILRRMG
jgi:MarR family transcriptional regulator, lower aerobic nicotinate degradation pathway regulator